MSVCFGFVWGTFIINLDRFITSSIKKNGDESKKLSFSENFFCRLTEIGHAMPRFIIALIIGLVISKPIELRLFKSDIDKNLIKNQQKLIKQKEKPIEEKYDSLIAPLKEDLKNLIKIRKEQIDDNRKELKKLRNDRSEEVSGTGGSGESGIGKIAEEKKDIYKDAKSEFDELKKENNAQKEKIEKKIKYHETEKRKELDKNQELIKKHMSDGLLSKIKALSNLAKENVTVWWTNILIICLICLIEMAPVFVKILSERGPYDALLDYFNKEIMFRADLDTENMRDEN